MTVRTLDHFASEIEGLTPALRKLDVQGTKLEVLRGAEQVLPSSRWVYHEISFLELCVQQPLADETVSLDPPSDVLGWRR